MAARDILISRVEAHLRRTGLSEAQFGKAVTGDTRWVSRLRAGKVALATIERAEALMAVAAVENSDAVEVANDEARRRGAAGTHAPVRHDCLPEAA